MNLVNQILSFMFDFCFVFLILINRIPVQHYIVFSQLLLKSVIYMNAYCSLKWHLRINLRIHLLPFFLCVPKCFP